MNTKGQSPPIIKMANCYLKKGLHLILKFTGGVGAGQPQPSMARALSFS